MHHFRCNQLPIIKKIKRKIQRLKKREKQLGYSALREIRKIINVNIEKSYEQTRRNRIPQSSFFIIDGRKIQIQKTMILTIPT